MPFQYRPSFDLNAVAQQLALAPRQVIEYAMLEAAKVVQTATPRDKGILVEHLASGKGPSEEGPLTVGYYGNLVGIRIGQKVAGSGFLRNFFASRYPNRKHGRPRPWPQAWKFMTKEEQQELWAGRVGGQEDWGGPYMPPGGPHYLGAISGGRNPVSSKHIGFVVAMGKMLEERLTILPETFAGGGP
jgi:hypothetical protein